MPQLRHDHPVPLGATLMPVIELVTELVKLIVLAVGTSKASQLLSDEAVRLANKQADELERLKWPS